ncbi:MAG: MMPL family transporter [Chloroflexota bacterium]|nr:MMPL family transporter [Chloroflexota bacterium]
MLSRITDFSSSPRGKWIVIALWVVLAALVIPLSPTLADVTDNSSANFLPEGAETTRVQELVDERFPSSTTPAIVVFLSEDGLSDDERAIADDLGQWALSQDAPEGIDPSQVVSIYTAPQAAEGLVSDDGTTMTMVIGIGGDPNGDPFLEAVEAIREQVADPPSGVDIAVSGPGGLILDLISVFETIDVFLTLVTAGLVLVLLIVIYRSPVIALVPLVSVGWVFALTGAVAAASAQQFDLLVNGQAQGIATVLLFGAGTDYCLFIASRFREELKRIEDKHEAMRATMRAVGEAIASSAGTVLVATFILSFAVLRSTAALGPLLSIAIGLMLIAGLTLVPAIVTVLGRFAFWPLQPKYETSATQDDRHEAGGGLWGTTARLVTGRPITFLIASVAVFAIFSLGLFQYRVTYDSISLLPVGAESREGFEWLRDSFPAGESDPVEVYVAFYGSVNVYDRLDEIEAMTTELGAYDGVASVESATAPLGAEGPIGRDQVIAAVRAVPEEARQAIDAGETGGAGSGGEGADPELAQAIGIYSSTRQFVSQDNGIARFDVILESSPYAIEQIDEIGDFREYARGAAIDTGLEGEVLVGGTTAVSYDTRQANDGDTLFIVPLILLAIGAILALLLRSLIAPLYLLGTIVLSYTATLGLTTWFFVNVFGYDGVGSAVPLYLFVFLAALGVDYNIYLMARIREETEGLNLHDGVQVALSRTGGVITSAGIILAGTFGALMTLPLRDLFQLGFAVAIGVLLDTFVVRTIMVPAIVVLLGRWNWWPGRRFRQS